MTEKAKLVSGDHRPFGDSFNSGQSRKVNKSFLQKLLLTLSKPWEERCNLYSLGNKVLLIFYFFNFQRQTKEVKDKRKNKIKEKRHRFKKGRRCIQL